MTTLADRIEGLAGPDREVDFEILASQGWVLEKRGKDRQEWWYKDGVDKRYSCYEYTHGYDAPPCYTASLDAAMTLVPKRKGKNDTLWNAEEWGGNGIYPALCRSYRKPAPCTKRTPKMRVLLARCVYVLDLYRGSLQARLRANCSCDGRATNIGGISSRPCCQSIWHQDD